MLALAVLLALLVSGGAWAQVAITTRVSVGSGDPGAQADDASFEPSISPDGRYVAFTSAADLAQDGAGDAQDGAGDPDGSDVFVRDLQAHTTILVSVREPCDLVGEFAVCPPGGDAFEPSISADGRFVAFTSAAEDLQLSESVTQLPFGARQVYVADLQEHTIRLASRDSIFNLDPGFGHSDQPSMSADGRYVAFRSFARLTNDTPFGDHSEVFVRDLVADETTLVSVHRECLQPEPPDEPDDSDGSVGLFGGQFTITQAQFPSPSPFPSPVAPCGGDSRQPSISGDGSSVAFASEAQDLPVEPPMDDGTFREHVFVRDRLSEITTLVTRDPGTGQPASGFSWQPSISDGGRFVAFTTDAAFGPSVPACAVGVGESCTDVVVWDRQSPSTFVLASVTLGGDRSARSHSPSIAGDGRSVAFASSSQVLVAEASPCDVECDEVYLRDLATAATEVISVDAEGNRADDDSGNPSASADGGAVAFDSAAALVPDDTNEVRDVYVRDRRVAEATVAPTDLDFGDQLVGTTSAPRVVTVTSTGTAPLETSTVTVAGTHPGDFEVAANTCAVVLQPGQACTIAVVFVPTAVGDRVATLVITNNAHNSPQEVGLRGHGTAPALVVNPEEIDFGAVPVDETSPPAAATAISVGTGPVTIGGVTISGTHAGDFGIVNDGCSGATLPPTVACVVLVDFSPVDVGPRTATLTVPSNAPDSPHTVRLVGEGLGGELVLAADPTDFGTVVVPGGSSERVVTGTNAGVAPLTVGTVSVAGVDAGGFTVVDENCSGAVLAPLAGCMVQLRLAPPTVGLFEADLIVTHSTAASPATAALRGVGVVDSGSGPGTGTGGPLLAVRPDVVEFGPRLAGVEGEDATITVTSVGTVPARVTDVTTEGPQSPEFVVGTDACSQTTLAVGASCEVTVGFAPAATGPHAADLVVRGEGGPVSAALQGTGQVPVLEVDPPLGRRGFVTTATGRDFPADTIVTLTFDPGQTRVLVRTDDTGAFEVPLLILRRDRVGPRELVATAPDVEVAVPYLVVPGRQVPPEFVNRY